MTIPQFFKKKKFISCNSEEKSCNCVIKSQIPLFLFIFYSVAKNKLPYPDTVSPSYPYITACCFVTVQFESEWKSDEIMQILKKKRKRNQWFWPFFMHTFS